MSYKNIVDVDITPAEQKLDILEDKIQKVDKLLGQTSEKAGWTFKEAVGVARTGFTLISSLATASGTSRGNIVSMGIAAAEIGISVYSAYASVTAVVNPVQAAAIYSQIINLIIQIALAAKGQAELSRRVGVTGQILNQFSSLISSVSFRL